MTKKKNTAMRSGINHGTVNNPKPQNPVAVSKTSTAISEATEIAIFLGEVFLNILELRCVFSCVLLQRDELACLIRN